MHVSHRAASTAVASGSTSPWEINRIRATCSELRIIMSPPSLGTVCHGVRTAAPLRTGLDAMPEEKL
ncbi:hypothetical protein GCM10009670_20190 [Citricoccus alkalitolerans]